VKILSIGNFGYGWDGSICDEEHIASALEQLGHEVIRCQRDHQSYVWQGDRDFILIAQWDGYNPFLREAARKSTDAPIVYWAFDYQADGQEWHERLIAQSDLYLSKRIADSKYPNWQWLSQDFAPNFLYKHPLHLAKDIDVLFTGSYLPWATERNETLKAVDEKFNLVIHSVNDWPGFKDVRPPVMDEGLPELYARAKIILSIDHTIEAGYWSDRNAQIMACGGRPLFRYVPLSEARFGQYVDYFYSLEGCLNSVQYRLEFALDMGVDLDIRPFKVLAKAQDLLTIVKGVL
jgi:hypothetical protein